MAFRPNYRFERFERERLKREKKEEKLRRQQERALQPDDANPAGPDATSQPED